MSWQSRLRPLGFNEERLNFVDTQNLWLRKGERQNRCLYSWDIRMLYQLARWMLGFSPPFEPSIRDGKLYGRGAADMKGGIAAFVTAVERFIANHPSHKGSIAVMMTSDEEGIATNGVVKVVEVLEARNEKIDWCLVGEPSSDISLSAMLLGSDDVDLYVPS